MVYLRLIDLEFEDNWPNGALQVQSVQRLDVSSCNFRNNSGGDGGSLYIGYSQRVAMDDVLVTDSVSIDDGGGAFPPPRRNRVLLFCCFLRLAAHRSPLLCSGVLYERQ